MNALPQFSPPFTAIDVPVPAHDPRREIRIGAALIGIFFVGFAGWAAVARLDSAVHAGGVVRVMGSRQAVQSQTGGVVTAIYTREGARVRAGEPLVNFASVDVLAQERSLASRVIGLQAEIARIEADMQHRTTIVAPAAWATLNPEEHVIADRALAGEQANLVARRALIASEQAVLRERLTQVRNQVEGYQRRRSSSVRQGAINVDELTGVDELYKKGFATKSRVLALQRSAASIDGDVGAIDAEIGRLGASSGETRMQMLQMLDQRDRENADRMRSAQTELQTVLPQWKAAREQMAQAVARAPVSGTVMGLVANTVGGVSPRGEKLMDIIPDKRALEIEARIALNDANDLRVGQKADVRIGGMRGRDLPLLHGKVSRVSADSVTDEKTGLSYFTSTVSIPEAEMKTLTRISGMGDSIRPGTPVEVIVPLQRRTALEYWLSPLLHRFSPAMAER
ncbi:HlyD family type I secretion periplasmic adaptor subunit [Sphingobium sp.]|uniref:HlyD family type I secretion periplasmic adaptor subunit n=1 Tax=Sphingobium sp. TaxID=1912891 RepID=UPI003BB692EB